jgi:hypothetical protein
MSWKPLTDRERQVLEQRFGLVDGYSRTLEEVGKAVPGYSRADPPDRGKSFAQNAASNPDSAAGRFS